MRNFISNKIDITTKDYVRLLIAVVRFKNYLILLTVLFRYNID